jgi:hypothetical protein
MRRCAGRLLGVLAIGLGSACGGEPNDTCTPLTVSVTARAPDPVFNWASACPAAGLFVSPADSVQVFVWSAVASPGNNTIRGPVTYGIAPSGIAVMTPAEPLVSGRQYRIQISRAFGIGFEEMGVALFTLP